MISLWKRKSPATSSSKPCQEPQKKLRREFIGESMDLEFEADTDFLGKKSDHFIGTDEKGYFDDYDVDSCNKYTLHPIYNDKNLVHRAQRNMFMELVKANLREYGHDQTEIDKRMKDKLYLNRVYEFLANVNKPKAIVAE